MHQGARQVAWARSLPALVSAGESLPGRRVRARPAEVASATGVGEPWGRSQTQSLSLVRVPSTVRASLRASAAAVPASAPLPISVTRRPHARSLGLFFLKAEQILESVTDSALPPFPHPGVQHVAAMSSVKYFDGWLPWI